MANIFEEAVAEYDPNEQYTPSIIASGEQMSLPRTVIGGAIATLGDFAATTWNSLTPEKYNLSTSELLGKIDSDALQIYEENPETIQTLSFVGGLVAPIGVSMKLMNEARAGMKGTGWFTEAGRVSRLKEADEAFALAGHSSEYARASRAMYGAAAANALVDSVAAEAAIVMTMNAHPYMEDYMEDLGKNFMIGTAIGGAIGVPMYSIIAAKELSAVGTKYEKELFGVLRSEITPVDNIAFNAEQIAVRQTNMDNLKDVLRRAADPEDELILSQFTKSGIDQILVKEEARIADIFSKSASEEMQKLPADIRQHYIDLLARTEMAGVEKVGFAKVSDEFSTGKSGLLNDTVNLYKKLTNKAGDEKLLREDAYFSTVYNRFFGKGDEVNYLTMADLGKKIETLEKEALAEYKLSGVPRDTGLTLGIEHSAKVDAEYAKEFLAYSEKTLADLSSKAVSPEDLPRLKAIFTRASKIHAETGVDPVLALKVTNVKPSYATQERLIMRQMGLDPNYGQRLRAMEADWEKYSLHKSDHPYRGVVSKEAEDALVDWISYVKHGAYLKNGAQLIRGATSEINRVREGMRPEVYGKATEARDILLEIKGSKQSESLRNAFRKMADADGNVWLLRGMHGVPDGHSPIESYTILTEKAAEFGNVSMYKVRVDDIIGTVHDFGSNGKKPEILVLAPTRDAAAAGQSGYQVPDKLVAKDFIKEQQTATIGGVTTGIKEVKSLADLEALIVETTRKEIQNLQGLGHGMESIALRLGMNQQSLESIMATGVKNLNSISGLIKYGSKADIEMALNPANRTMALSTNLHKVPEGELFANLNHRNMEWSSKNIIEATTLSSTHQYVRELGEKLFNQENKLLTHMLDLGIQDITKSELGNAFFRSANSVLEKFGETGVAASVLGKNVVALKNQIKESFEKPLAEKMAQLAKTPEELIEAYTAINLNASLSGRRFYKAGQIWQPKSGIRMTTFEKAVKEMSDDEFVTWAKTGGKDGTSMAEAAKYRGTEFSVKSKNVRDFMELTQDYGRQMYGFKSNYNSALGKVPPSDIGLWIPSFNPVNKEIAYVYDMVTQQTSMLYAKTPEELRTMIAGYRSSLMGRNPENVKIITKDMQEDFNKIANRHDPMYMSIADTSMQHSGASQATIVSTNTEMLQEILGGYAHHIDSGINQNVELMLGSTMEHLKNVSAVSNFAHSDSTLGTIKQIVNNQVDPGQVMKNIILGKSNLYEYKGWAEWQQRTEAGVEFAITKVGEAFSFLKNPLSKSAQRTPQEWEEIEKKLAASGIPNPFEGLDKAFGTGRYVAEGTTSGNKLTSRAITLSNSLAATSLLRFAELGQPLVNAISLPILTSGALNRIMAQSFDGIKINPNAKFSAYASLLDGVRLMNHTTEAAKIEAYGKANNIFKSVISEANELMHMTKQLDPGKMKVVEDLLESKLVQFMSKPADIAEEYVRRVGFFTGVNIARKAYPGISERASYIFARSFMDEAIGNYLAPQRPAFFQGAVGTAMGLFQTYMLTMAQQIYRGVENRNWAALGKQMLTQAGIFGGASLPGFSQVSEGIANHFSDNNIDLQTGTFRAIPEEAANILLYGLPSSIGAGVYTRGDIQPRVPNPLGGVDQLAAINIGKQMFQAADRVASAAFTADANAGRAIMEAISLQSINRPIARMAELVTGESITRKGDIVATGLRPTDSVDQFLSLSTLSRMFATRPLEEIKLREALHLDTLYGSIDREKREAVTFRLKSYIRGGELTEERLELLAEEYLRTGSAQGWRSAVNKAIMQTQRSGQENVLEKLKKGSPLGMMIEDRD